MATLILWKILRSRKKSTANGPLSQLQLLEDALLRYIFELHKQRISVNMFIVVLRASFLSPEFCAKNFTEGCSTVKRFFIAHLFTYQMDTHTLQRMPAEVESKALDFMMFMLMRRIIFGANRDRSFVINVDQTPVYFSMNANCTLELIDIRTSTDNTKQVTMVVTICADSTLLPLMLVYKGQLNGRIAKKEFLSGFYPSNHFYHCWPAVWMDKMGIIVWVNDVLKPYIVTAPDHVVPILILDMYQCHMMASVVQMIQELGVEVKHIPLRMHFPLPARQCRL